MFKKFPVMATVALALTLGLGGIGLVPATVGQTALAERIDEDAWKELEKEIKGLSKATPAERIAMYHRLGDSDHPKAAKALVEVIKKKAESDQKARYEVFRAMGKFSDADALKEVSGQVAALTKELGAGITKGGEAIYDLFLILEGLCQTNSEETRAIVMTVLDIPEKDRAKPNTVWQRAAALEAIGATSCVPFFEYIVDLLKVNQGWDKDQQFVAKQVLAAGQRIGENLRQNGDARYLDMMEAMAEALKLYSDERIRFFTAIALHKVARNPEGATDFLGYWIWWIDAQRRGLKMESQTPPKHERGGTDARPAFVEMEAVGRIAFCIDISDSMKEEVSPGTKAKRQLRETEKKPALTGREAKEEKDKKPEKQPLDWSKIKTKLDLAKADLIRSIDTLTERYSFNVVVYGSGVRLIDDKTLGFVVATPANRNRFKQMVQDLELDHMTNIHGALLEAFSLYNEGNKGQGKGAKLPAGTDGAYNEKTLLNGADTVFFLTDGWGSWDNQSNDRVPDKRDPNNKALIGNGPYIYAEDILTDFERMNRFRKVVVNTVGIGNHDKKLMQGIAKASGGTYVDLGD